MEVIFLIKKMHLKHIGIGKMEVATMRNNNGDFNV